MSSTDVMSTTDVMSSLTSKYYYISSGTRYDNIRDVPAKRGGMVYVWDNITLINIWRYCDKCSKWQTN